MEQKYKIGDRVRIKSLDWYNENKDEGGYINCGSRAFFTKMSDWCGKILTINRVVEEFKYYCVSECIFSWTDEMIECKVEEENTDCEKCGLTRNSTRCLFMDSCTHNKQKNIIEIPKDYVIKDENSNVINATKIVLEKKKKEYPKTYTECSDILSVYTDPDISGYKGELLWAFQKLLVCRDAYWKIAGEEMGLGKPWEPDWTNYNDYKFVIGVFENKIIKCYNTLAQYVLAFPTEEMRDTFKENFGPDIEICKKIL